MLDLEGKELTQIEREILQHPSVGGIILFARNFDSPNQIKYLIKEIRHVRQTLLIAVDQEGGRVQRFQEGFTRLPPMAEFGKLYKKNPEHAKKLTENCAQTMAKELLAIGINFSFAPVLDVDQGISQIIGDRSFSDDPELVCDLAESFINGMRLAGMLATGKHFPGHGGVAADSHTELPVDKRELASLWKIDLLPYQRLKNKLTGIMTAHIIYSKMDQKPASFSQFWLQEILRKQLQFEGVIFSDDLNMAGANYAGDFFERAQLALTAGCDMVLICNNRRGAIQILDKLNYISPISSQERLRSMSRI
jgi:beta-N-acetylhexosaminidase